MKKTISILVLVFIAVSGFSQSDKTITFEPRIGINLSGLSEGDLDMKLAVKAGVGVEYAFSDLFALRPGLFFSMKGATIADNQFGFNPDETFNFSYLEIPVLASFRFPVTENFSLTLNGGPYAGFRISKEPAGFTDVTSIDVGVAASLDFVISRFVIGVEGQYGLAEVVKDSDAHLYNYSLTFGYRF